jgi:hypothetical protein
MYKRSNNSTYQVGSPPRTGADRESEAIGQTGKIAENKIFF